MKKIKEYINNHQRLKKTLKILGVFAVIFSVAFNILIIGVASCYNYRSNDDEEAEAITTPLATTPVAKGMYNDAYYTYYGLNDIASYTFFQLFINNLKDYYYVYNSNVTTENFLLGQSVTFNFDSSYNIYIGGYSDGAFDGGDRVTQLTISYDNSLDYSSTISYAFSFGNYTTRVEAYYKFSDTSKTYCISNNATFGVSYSVTTLRVDNEQFRALFPADVSRTNYESGYSEGYNYGYIKGYDTGYTDGTTQGDLTPFGLIKSAFDSIVSILNIQLLPGITLSAIIFTPLIVTIIIVIVKMFKG